MSRNCFWDRYLGRAGQLLANRPFAASNSRATKLPCWRAKVALGQDKQKEHIILNGNIPHLSCPSATFALQHEGFVPRTVNGQLQRAFFSLSLVTVPEAFAKVNLIQFPSSKVADGRKFCFMAYEKSLGGI